MLSQIYYTVLNLLFTYSMIIKTFLIILFLQNDLNQSKTNLELFYKETREIKPTNEDQKKT